MPPSAVVATKWGQTYLFRHYVVSVLVELLENTPEVLFVEGT